MSLVSAPTVAPRRLTNEEPEGKPYVLHGRQEALGCDRPLRAPVAEWCWVVTATALGQLEEEKLFRFDGIFAVQVAQQIKGGAELDRRLRAARYPDGPSHDEERAAPRPDDLKLDWVALEERHSFSVGDSVDG